MKKDEVGTGICLTGTAKHCTAQAQTTSRSGRMHIIMRAHAGPVVTATATAVQVILTV
jgi:hypothetical protein